MQQLVITGHYANGGIQDVTRQVRYRAVDPKVVRVDASGSLAAVHNGTTEVIAEFQGQAVKVLVTVEEADREQPINFTNEIVPIFSKLGCNSGACHGKSTGQNGFRLSLLGFEPQVDFEALTREWRGRRICPVGPRGQFAAAKADRHDAPRRRATIECGFARLPDPAPLDSRRHAVRQGFRPEGRGADRRPGTPASPPKSKMQITVAAVFSDGSRRDVTADAEYSSNNPEIADVVKGGLIETLDTPGDGAIMVRYLGHVGVFRVTIPQDAPLEKYTFPQPANFVDEHVFARLKQLRIPPSELCSDGEFLRRVSLDITGTLPTAKEAEKFLADTDADKRGKLVDDLLRRPAYASYFALKWGDILRNRRDGIVGVGGKQERTLALHALASRQPGQEQAV